MNSGARRSTYRSLRSVPPPKRNAHRYYVGVGGVIICLVVLLTCAVLPVAWLDHDALYDAEMTQPHGLGAVVRQSIPATQQHQQVVNRKSPAEDDEEEEDSNEDEQQDKEDDDDSIASEHDEEEEYDDEKGADREKDDDDGDDDGEQKEKRDLLTVMNRKVELELPKVTRERPSHLDRGVSGLPMEETPALIGAQRGHIQECNVNVNVDAMAYWNDPQGDVDANFDRAAPFQASTTGSKRYLTFEPDSGGWNNMRMSFENIFVFCAATGRTLVLPPPFEIYNTLTKGKKKEHGFGDSFPLDKLEMQKHCPMMMMEEFIRMEGGIQTKTRAPLIAMDEKTHKIAVKASKDCEAENDSTFCMTPMGLLRVHG
eukprot:scaffold33277_cov41-Attheya_sp.AAC.1